MKIIIVDDNKSIRDVLRTICEGEDHQVVAELGDGVGLLDLVKNQRPDVVCLDFNLPGEDGLELLVQMDVTANMVDVIMITGSDDPELKGHAADLGAAGFIHKPFEHQQVIDELKAIQETRRIAARAAQMPTPVEAAEAIPAKTVATEPEAPAKTAPAVAIAVAVSTPAAVPTNVPVFPRTAVVVDDSGSIRLLLKGILEEIGVKVVGLAANGRDGVEIVKKTRPAMVCLDVDMPNMTGLEALPHVRAASPQTKVVMITGNASRAVVEAAVAGGARGYFLKPIRPAKVEEFIQKLLQR